MTGINAAAAAGGDPVAQAFAGSREVGSGLIDVAALQRTAVETRKFLEGRRAAGDARYAAMDDAAIDAEITAALRTAHGEAAAALVKAAQQRRGGKPLSRVERAALLDPQGVYDRDRERGGSKLVGQYGEAGAREILSDAAHARAALPFAATLERKIAGQDWQGDHHPANDPANVSALATIGRHERVRAAWPEVFGPDGKAQIAPAYAERKARALSFEIDAAHKAGRDDDKRDLIALRAALREIANGSDLAAVARLDAAASPKAPAHSEGEIAKAQGALRAMAVPGSPIHRILNDREHPDHARAVEERQRLAQIARSAAPKSLAEGIGRSLMRSQGLNADGSIRSVG
jgi:hypothetical protein